MSGRHSQQPFLLTPPHLCLPVCRVLRDAGENAGEHSTGVSSPTSGVDGLDTRRCLGGRGLSAPTTKATLLGRFLPWDMEGQTSIS